MTAAPSVPPVAPVPGSIETPTGKGAGDENFPVGSFLISAPLRPAVATYYAFARAIDDIADNPGLTAKDKLDRLKRMNDALNGRDTDPGVEKAVRLREVLLERDIPLRHAGDLISAFRQDAVKARYRTWDELIDYCNRSAAPVGRFLVDLHGEGPEAYPAADALSNALQVLNHLQDCVEDYRSLDRVYLPQDWLDQEGITEAALLAPKASPELRRVIDFCLDGCETLIDQARPLRRAIADRRFAMEAATIVSLADRLRYLLRTGDPIRHRVALSKADFAVCGLRGVLAAVLGSGPKGKQAVYRGKILTRPHGLPEKRPPPPPKRRTIQMRYRGVLIGGEDAPKPEAKPVERDQLMYRGALVRKRKGAE